MKKGLTRAYIIVGAALPLFFLFSLVYDASTSTEESDSIDRLTELKLEQVELLSGINYHQTQLNTATVRLGKVETAVTGLEGLGDFEAGTHYLTDGTSYEMSESDASYKLSKELYAFGVDNSSEASRDDTVTMLLICKHAVKDGRVSPLCNNWDLFNEFKDISESRGIDFRLMLGMAYAESHIGTNFAPTQECKNANNWAGMKRHRLSDGKFLPKAWRGGCSLQQHASIQEGWASMANILKFGYYPAGGTTPETIVESWVGKYSENWVKNVNLFYK